MSEYPIPKDQKGNVQTEVSPPKVKLATGTLSQVIAWDENKSDESNRSKSLAAKPADFRFDVTFVPTQLAKSGIWSAPTDDVMSLLKFSPEGWGVNRSSVSKDCAGEINKVLEITERKRPKKDRVGDIDMKWAENMWQWTSGVKVDPNGKKFLGIDHEDRKATRAFNVYGTPRVTTSSDVEVAWILAGLCVLCVFGLLVKTANSRWKRICCRQRARTRKSIPKASKVTAPAIPTVFRKRTWTPSAQIAAASKLPVKTSTTKTSITSMEPEALPTRTPKLVRGPTVPPFQMFPRCYANKRDTAVSALKIRVQPPPPDTSNEGFVLIIE